MKINSFRDLVAAVQAMEIKSRVVVAAAHDDHTLESLIQAQRDGLVKPILVGDEEKIREILAAKQADSAAFEIVPAGSVEECLDKSVALIHQGKANILMKGKLETGQIMKAIIDKKNDLKRGGLISLMGFYTLPAYHKLFAVSDMGMNTYPDLEGKRHIIENAVHVLHALGVEKPKVAVLSAVEKVNPKMPDAVDGGKLKELCESGELAGCVVEGPISFDLATCREAAVIKNYTSPVAGDADLLVVPDIVCGNVLVKCLTGLAGAKTAGLVVGAKVPVILTSRSAEASDKYYSIALAAYTAQNY
ncbi:MAG TPA: bifunctional enoyl-CoA hydratase/phosphate acetyltransferase [Pseudoflavonifractor sp.]|nr:bifunctional enoyl-CoA hydratase/phosphate acetyltransferase [Pseudoflavonifractor sp.]